MIKKAKIYTYTVIYTAAEDFKDKTPYAVGILDSGNDKFAAFIDGYREGVDIGVGKEVEYSHDDDKGNAVYRLR